MIDGTTLLIAGNATRAQATGHSVSAGAVSAFLDYVVTRGALRTDVLNQASLTLTDLRDRDARLPLTSYITLIRAAKAQCNDAALALHYGETVACANVSIVGAIGHAADTMAEGLAQLNRYASLTIDFGADVPGDRYQVQQHAGGAWLVDVRPLPALYPEITESVFARMAIGSRQISESRAFRAIHLAHPQPAYLDEYHRIFRAPVQFGCERNAVLLDPSWASQPVAQSPRYLFDILKAHADTLLAELTLSSSWHSTVERAVLPRLRGGDLSMDRVARELAVSRQTLYRRLKAEGITFIQLVDAVRHRLAMQYLADRRISVSETGYMIGFSDPAAFSRAFKRWTGDSPIAFRERHIP
jgi:AraC-like DNA-binding protein